MAARAKRIDIRSILIAEDVRQEVNGLQTIVGVYGNTINTGAPRAILSRIMFRIEFVSTSTFQAKCNLGIISPSGKQVFGSPAPAEMDVKAGISAVCCIGWGPVAFDESGIYSIHFGVNTKPKKISEFSVNLNRKPPENLPLKGDPS